MRAVESERYGGEPSMLARCLRDACAMLALRERPMPKVRAVTSSRGAPRCATAADRLSGD